MRKNGNKGRQLRLYERKIYGYSFDGENLDLLVSNIQYVYIVS